MDWIKKNTDQFALAVLSLVLVALSGLIIFKASTFGDSFSAIQTTPPRNDNIPPLQMAVMTEAQQSAEKPAQWIPKRGSLFVSEPFFVEGGRLVKLDRKGMNFPPVRNAWLSKYGLSLLDPNVLNDDPDKDGFTNLDEFLGASRSPEGGAEGDPDSTNPLDKDSHPPYYTQLWLKEWIRIRFNLLFKGYDGDPAKPDTLNVQINAAAQPTQFRKIGDLVEGSKYRVEKFEYKTKLNPSTGNQDDVSELSLLNTESNETVVLPKNVLVNSPDSLALFIYRWPKPPLEFKVRKLQEFVLRPNVNEKYKLIDIKETEAVILLPSGEKYAVPHINREQELRNGPPKSP
jgi:hypothetical protein